MEDIKVNDDWQITRAASGDAPLCRENEEFIQSIKLESMTQEGDLFYDLEYGWSLLDFLHSTNNELTKVAIQERIRGKMANRPEIDISSLQVDVNFMKDMIYTDILFRKKNADNTYLLKVALDRVRVEVITDD